MKYFLIKTTACILFATSAAWCAAAQQAAPQTSPIRKTALSQQPQKQQGDALKGKQEKLECKLGTEDRHARIAVELVGGRTKSIAYYSKWKPRTCSVHILRDDAYSKWQDTGNVTLVTLSEEKGSFLIDHEKRQVKFLFRDIDRERFCGMEGKISGSLTVTRGRDRCELEGVMDESNETVVEAAEVKATEVKAAEVKAAEVKATEVKATEVKATEVKAAEAEAQTAAFAQ